MQKLLVGSMLIALCQIARPGAQDVGSVRTFALETAAGLEVRDGRLLEVEYRGRKALRLAPRAENEHGTDQELVAVLEETDFQDGVIELDLAGARRAGYASDNASAFKGFIGLAFRVDGERAERFYLRTENARLDDQVFRNRSTQYESDPDYSWQRLRQEAPGQYESYVDLEPGAWTTLRIVVSGTSARLFVNGAAQPCLVVTDLKHGATPGRIALWAHVETEAYFGTLTATWR